MTEHDMETSIQNLSALLTRLSIHKIHRKLKEKKLSITHMNSLSYIYHHENTSVSDIGEMLSISTAAASQLLEKMVQMELIDRREDSQDRRLKHLILTPKGIDLMKEIKHQGFDWTGDFAKTISPEDTDQYCLVLNDLYKRITEYMQIEEHK